MWWTGHRWCARCRRARPGARRAGRSFTGAALFSRTVFKDQAVFQQARFAGTTSFDEAVFASVPALQEATAQPTLNARRSWPAGWSEAARSDGSETLKLVWQDTP
ncbi:pentapeptide repeat-containing protein [Sphaerisporangium sp. NPDC005288]|uniref:pentapeptide repeat-containing protein n=1 Tax=Sphaerisporangium sp. NPDC005288 TaxID=3155114 RepID=UPI0033AFCA75